MIAMTILKKMSAREQLMLGSLILVLFMIWGSILLKQSDKLSERIKGARSELRKQAIWLADADRFEDALDESLALLDPAKTLNADKLVALVDELARREGMTHDLGNATTIEQKAFTKHTLNVGIRNCKIEPLIAFERSLHQHYPHVAFESFSLSANKTDPRFLNARVTLVSYQLQADTDATQKERIQ